jgi:hypothetical protein
LLKLVMRTEEKAKSLSPHHFSLWKNYD